MGFLGKVIVALRRRRILFLVNHLYSGTRCFEKKRRLLIKIGWQIGEGTKIVGPVFCTARIVIGKECWIGKNFTVEGNGNLTIMNNCDVGPNVTVLTGSHEVGDRSRRAGKGFNSSVIIGDGTWVCANSLILPGVEIGEGCVVAAGTVVTNSIPKDSLGAGVPCKVKKTLA